jgi:hypothetical protein
MKLKHHSGVLYAMTATPDLSYTPILLNAFANFNDYS